MPLTKSKERIDEHSEVYTPEWLVNEMLDTYSSEEWADVEFGVLEPTCGNGNFLVEIVRRKIKAGLSVEQTLETTFGVDILPDNVREAQKRMLKTCEELSGRIRNEEWVRTIMKNIVAGDALTHNFEF